MYAADTVEVLNLHVKLGTIIQNVLKETQNDSNKHDYYY